jgi:benzoyl-CoA reductase/2-hydroxyglutaryl-CoA dehydratase subunit BcrC/BadD/HgdB
MDNGLITLIRELQAQSNAELAASGRKVVGTLCLASPVELIEAAGAVPVRLMAAGDEAELRGRRFLASDSCSFCKAVLGSLDINPRPDAVLGATTCDQMRRNLEIISRDLHIPVFIFNAPRTADNHLSRKYAQSEIKRIFEELCGWSDVKAEAEELTAAIRRRQEVRRRIQTLLDWREAAQPRLTGGEFQVMMTFYQAVPLDVFERRLPEIEEYIREREPLFYSEPLRIALLGSCVGEDDGQIIELLEETRQATIVYDAVCTGSRALFGLSDSRQAGMKSDDPFEALVNLYHDQVYCPHKRPNDKLFEIVLHDVQRLNIQGVIFKTLKFCHPWGFEARRFKETLGLPFLHLDHDYSPSATGQLRTRIHAFLEALSFSR